MSWGKAIAVAWGVATDSAKAEVSQATRSMAAAADLATKVTEAAKSVAAELGNLRDKVADTYHSIKQKFSLRKAANVPVQECSAPGQTLGDLDCPGLARQEDKIAQAQIKAKLAVAVYQEPEQQILPQGWSQATDDDLRNLGLMDSQGRKLTEIPDSDFRADVFRGPDGKTVVAFKGTMPTSLEDWKNNIQQGTGNPSEYYRRAMTIADRIDAYQPGNVEYVGHSLGGGLASAAAAMHDSLATTFNAAGLNDETLLRDGIVPNSEKTDAYYVEGGILSTLQDKSFGLLPQAAGGRIPLSPADAVTWSDVAVGVLAKAARWRLGGLLFGVVIGAGAVARGIRLHGMGSVKDALAKRRDQINRLQEQKGCT